jgi:hypothetical protein
LHNLLGTTISLCSKGWVIRKRYNQLSGHLAATDPPALLFPFYVIWCI